jgi:hypothetical protein
MIKYQVLDNGRPADCHHQKVDKSWNRSMFDSYREALTYARKWLGDAWGGSNDGTTGVVLKVDTSWEYSGYGDHIEIRRVKV